MQMFIKPAVLAAVLFGSLTPALADGFGTPSFTAPSTTTTTDPLPEGGWGLIIDSNVSWMSGTLGQGSVFSSDPLLAGTVDSVSSMVEDVDLTTSTTAGPLCGISCENVNISLDGSWNSMNTVTATMSGSGLGTVDSDGLVTPFTAGARAQTQGLIDMTGAFQFTYGPDVVIPVTPDP